MLIVTFNSLQLYIISVTAFFVVIRVLNVRLLLHSAMQSETVPTYDALRKPEKDDENRCSADETVRITEAQQVTPPLSSSLERTPSMKILISSKASKSLSARRGTAIVRVNSKASG